jgi:DNA-binding CsgD family transcriptional regulator
MIHLDRLDPTLRAGSGHRLQGTVIDLRSAIAGRHSPLPARRALPIGDSRRLCQPVWEVREDAPDYRRRPDHSAVWESWPDDGPPLVVLAVPGGREFMMDAVRAGATLYVLRDAGEMAEVLAGRMKAAVPAAVVPPATPPPDPLTRRQRDVLRQVALGRATKEIAYQLRLSPKTVAAHRGHIMERLGVRDVAGLVVYALRRGIVDIGEYGEPPEMRPAGRRRVKR